jgi:hypothetical protein
MASVLVAGKTRVGPLAAWGLVGGGVLFFVGGLLHPKEDPVGVGLKEHMRAEFLDRLWYPSHSLLLAGTVLMAVSLVVLLRAEVLPRVRMVLMVAAVATCLAAVGALLHLVSAAEGDAVASGAGTPLIDVQLVVETVTVPAFGFSVAVLAVLGAMRRTLGNPVTAVLGFVGGVGYGLAGAAVLFNDPLDFLFPAASGIALWAVGVGIAGVAGAWAWPSRAV